MLLAIGHALRKDASRILHVCADTLVRIIPRELNPPSHTLI